MDVIIDGYNLLFTFSKSPNEIDKIELFEILSSYRLKKQFNIIVVFDAKSSYSLGRHTFFEKGIKVIYSRGGESADDLIKEMVSKKPEVVVVSSDRDVASFCDRKGASTISSKDFLKRVFASISGQDYHLPERKVKRKERKKIKRLRKL